MARIIPERDGHRSQPAATEVADLVTALSRHLRRSTRAELEPLGVTWGQVRALRAVAGDGPVRMSALADRLGVARRSATSVVDELVDRGLVARAADPGDRRAVVVDLTAAGRTRLEEVERIRARVAQDLVAGLAPDQQAALIELLRRLLPPGG